MKEKVSSVENIRDATLSPYRACSCSGYKFVFIIVGRFKGVLLLNISNIADLLKLESNSAPRSSKINKSLSCLGNVISICHVSGYFRRS